MKTTDFLEKQEREYIGPKGSLKRHHKECPKNDYKPHDFKEVDRKYYEWSHSYLVDYVCVHCGKKDFKSERQVINK